MSPYSMLSALSQQSDNKKILVRVGRIWEAVNRKNNTLLHTNVILLDEKDDHILAIVRNNQRDAFLPMLKENEVYSISNLKLVPGPKLYRSVDRDLSVNFFYKTKIEEHQDTGSIPRYKFELQPFHRVKDLVGDTKCLIDVIGMVMSYGQLEKRSHDAQKMDVVLIDTSYRVVIRIEDGTGSTTLTLFNKEAEQIIGAPLNTLLKEIEKEKLAEIPPALKNLIGKKCAFQIKITPYNIEKGCEEYTVTRVSEFTLPPITNDAADSSEGSNKKQRTA
ncbi:hypothetical protein DCAR_0623909 [Daucus carota subsp. sativus]|uniref:Replication protein A 70 kDa DNA-binding subunit B/D first OB fold domain-containing protein n=1 Tax=Daucus carota subsp. sativus TaxID=79200 RepID=A0A164VHQ9_DAUCS|nr:hypothetical protein DCAR_0623909 [Daucus carota subsp. sativus]